MILIYVCLAIVHLAGISSRTIDLSHDPVDDNDQIAHFLLPLLGSDDKGDLKVEVLPYHDHKNIKKDKTIKKPVAAITPLDTKKKESPLAVILANAKFRKNLKSKDRTRLIKLPLWDGAKDKSNEDEDDDNSIIIHVKRIKENVTKGEKTKVDHKKHTVFPEDSERSISSESNSNEHMLTKYDGKKYNEDHPEKSENSKEMNHVKRKDYLENYGSSNQIVKIVSKEEPNTQNTSKDEKYIPDGTKVNHDIGEIQHGYDTYNDSNNIQEKPRLNSSNKLENEQDKHSNAEKNSIIFNFSNDKPSMNTETKGFNSDVVSGDKDKKHEINVDLPLSKEVNEKSQKSYTAPKQESVMESESSEQDSSDNVHGDGQANPIILVDKLSTSTENDKLGQKVNPLVKVTQKHNHKDNSKVNYVSGDTPTPADKIINEIYHPNLHFESKPYSLKHKDKSTKDLKEVDDVFSKKALIKAYKLLLGKNSEDEKYHFATSKEKNIKHEHDSNTDQNTDSKESIESLENVIPKKEIKVENIPENVEYSSENVPFSEDGEKIRSNQIIPQDISDYGIDAIEYYEDVGEPEYEIISGSNAKVNGGDTETTDRESFTINKKNTLHEVEPSNTHVSNVPKTVLLNGGKVIKYEAPTNIRVVKKVDNKHSKNEEINHSKEYVRNIGVHKFEANDDDTSTKGTSEESFSDTIEDLPKSNENNRRDLYSSDENIVCYDKNTLEHVKDIKNRRNKNKKIGMLHRGDTTNRKALNKQKDAMACLLKKRTLLEDKKQDPGSKSYNLSFLFSRR